MADVRACVVGSQRVLFDGAQSAWLLKAHQMAEAEAEAEVEADGLVLAS